MKNCCLFIWMVVIGQGLTGCTQYEPQPLSPDEVMQDVEAQRQSLVLAPEEVFDFARAAQTMSEHSPQLAVLKARYAKWQAVSDTKTPWINPTLEVGPDLGSHLQPGLHGKTRPFVALGFTIPLGGRLSRQDDLNTAVARRAYLKLQVTHRELFLELKHLYAQLAGARSVQAAQKNYVQSLKKLCEHATTLQDLGMISALELGQVRQDLQQAEIEWFEAEEMLETLQARLSSLLGVDISAVTRWLLPPLPDQVPDEVLCRQLLINNNTELALLRADYEVAEKKLHLEISKQIPDLQLGAEREKEVGGDTVVLGLRLGIEIPVFDRNQQNIAQALHQREEIRRQYMAQAHEILSRFKKARALCRLSIERQKQLTESVIPQADANLRLAQQSMEVGGLDAFRYLQQLKMHQQTLRDNMILQNKAYGSLYEMEQVLGVPLSMQDAIVADEENTDE